MRKEAVSDTAGDAAIQAAIQMEEVGKDFYDALGAATSHPTLADLCRELSAQEAGHRETFRRIRSELARQAKTVLLSDDQAAEARQTVREAILPDRAAIRRLVSEGSVAALLQTAIQMEKDSIAYYGRLIGALPEPAAVEAVIREEQEHLRLLTAAGRGQETSK